MSKVKHSEQGEISIHTENIFPIIKKWLYSDKEIFLRELVSNAVDAIHKLQHINLVEGLKLEEDYAVDVTLDKDAGTLTVSDNGIGMTSEEIRRYINQIAFSSAEEFIEKFKGLDDKNQIIGHFGLGFYSSFMVASQVEIRSLSYQEGAEGAHWRCDGTTSYHLETIDKSKRGTDVVLHIEPEEKEFLDPSRIRQILSRYCNFLPVTIRLMGDVVNDMSPLWSKQPTEIDAEEYTSFYHKLYPLSDDPLFWIHLNIDYPFNLKGILYFPRLTNEFDVTKSHIKLFCNQVFVTDNCPELIPEFLLPLQGCLDAPDLPLNVSRSYLQNEPQVRKIQDVIAGRVAGKLLDIAKAQNDEYIKIWEDVHTFVKFGMMRDDKFYEKIKDQVIYRSTGDQTWTTLTAYLERARDSHENKVFYANNETAQATYLRMFKQQGVEVLILDAMIDTHFIQFLEMKNTDVKFVRVDSDITENLIDAESKTDLIEGSDQKSRNEKIVQLFKDILGEQVKEIRVEGLKDESVPVVVLQDEQGRRFQDMTRMLGDSASLQGQQTLMVNINNPVVKKIKAYHDAGESERVSLLIEQVYDLALFSSQDFDRDRMEAFLERSGQLLELLTTDSKD